MFAEGLCVILWMNGATMDALTHSPASLTTHELHIWSRLPDGFLNIKWWGTSSTSSWAPSRFFLECLRDLSSSLAAWAARSSPVGSKLLHLSLGLSPPPLEPPAGGGGGGGGWDGRPGGTSGCPLFKPNSHDILKRINKGQLAGLVRRLWENCHTALPLHAFRWNRLHMRSRKVEQL